MTACALCQDAERPALSASWQRIADDEYWRVVHASSTSLEGWLLLISRRHMTSIAEMTEAEAAALGRWQSRLARALHTVTGCVKVYVAQFAEWEGFAHTHFHVVPRSSDLPPDLQGPGIFQCLRAPEPERVSDARKNDVAVAIRQQLARQ